MDDGAPLREARTLPDLIGQLTSGLAELVRKESELIRAELSEKVNRAAKAVGDIAAGALLMIAALLVLLQALVLALSELMNPIWASLLVAVSVAVVGYVLLRMGMKAISLDGLKPDRSARQLKKNAELMKGTPK
jgi:putative superfamily III holin-X